MVAFLRGLDGKLWMFGGGYFTRKRWKWERKWKLGWDSMAVKRTWAAVWVKPKPAVVRVRGREMLLVSEWQQLERRLWNTSRYFRVGFCSVIFTESDPRIFTFLFESCLVWLTLVKKKKKKGQAPVREKGVTLTWSPRDDFNNFQCISFTFPTHS